MRAHESAVRVQRARVEPAARKANPSLTLSELMDEALRVRVRLLQDCPKHSCRANRPEIGGSSICVARPSACTVSTDRLPTFGATLDDDTDDGCDDLRRFGPPSAVPFCFLTAAVGKKTGRPLALSPRSTAESCSFQSMANDLERRFLRSSVEFKPSNDTSMRSGR